MNKKTKADGRSYQYQIMSSPVGKIFIIATHEKLAAVCLQKNWKDVSKTFPYLENKSNPIIHQTQQELTEYFQGQRKNFSVPILMEGTDFQKKSWKALQSIPYGKTISYSKQARMIKSPLAVRAVGTANSRNPICIIVPCHRVISESGQLAGYAGGIAVKKYLLNLEKNEGVSSFD